VGSGRCLLMPNWPEGNMGSCLFMALTHEPELGGLLELVRPEAERSSSFAGWCSSECAVSLCSFVHTKASQGPAFFTVSLRWWIG
jgi:hypothetical protein